jgi:hypothetical protein
MIDSEAQAKQKAEIAAAYTAAYYARLEMTFGPEKANKIFPQHRQRQ